MTPWRYYRPLALTLLGVCWAALAVSPALAETRAKTLAADWDKATPEDIEALKAIQKQVKIVLKKVMPATVSVRVAGAHGSGVIVDKEGHVLTAGHVAGEKPGKAVTIIMHDGRKLKGKTLGYNRDMDSGMIQITEEGDWPHVAMGRSRKLKKGQWCLAVGHPGGYKAGRSPVVRLGRVLDKSEDFIQTDCALVGGDSGGPLFDLDGKVIAIHSRIGKKMTINLHVPVDTYRNTWNRLVKGDVWGDTDDGPQAYLGVKGGGGNSECKITEVVEDSPADKAGLRKGDVITHVNRESIDNFGDLKNLIGKHKPGERVTLQVRRGDESFSVRVILGKMEDD
jgi:serine protease Do